jgi:hypothetical protein
LLDNVNIGVEWHLSDIVNVDAEVSSDSAAFHILAKVSHRRGIIYRFKVHLAWPFVEYRMPEEFLPGNSIGFGVC